VPDGLSKGQGLESQQVKNRTSKMSLRGWVIALLSLIASLLWLNRGMFPEAPGNRDKTLKSEESVAPSVLFNPMRDGSRWFPGLKQGRANSKPLPPPSDVRSDSRFSGAIDTFDQIQLTMDKLPSKYGNARKYLNGLKEKLPVGTPYGQRSLPPDTSLNDYHVYEFIKPLPVQSGQIAAWFGQPGGGVQHYTKGMGSISNLLGQYLKEVWP
jgi:hypothetical protein